MNKLRNNPLTCLFLCTSETHERIIWQGTKGLLKLAKQSSADITVLQTKGKHNPLDGAGKGALPQIEDEIKNFVR